MRKLPPEVIAALNLRANRPPDAVLCALCNNPPAWRVVPIAPVSGSRRPKQLHAILLCNRCIDNRLPPGWLAFSLARPDSPPRCNEIVYIPEDERDESRCPDGASCRSGETLRTRRRTPRPRSR